MYFKRIEMHGFKSFAEPVVIEFHEGVTCIVGPNGSGKSNISDAIRWVLGEQSPKMLRGGKMEEVIFAGTASRKSRGMAEVTLVIDNSTGILPIDYSEVAITRRMYRSGESEYLINNNRCRLRDIRELIMDTGIGVDGYSIIGQGKIADIVSNKPESRREIFEEAAGIVMYKSKKSDAERRLQNTNANLERVNDIVGEIEGRIDGLREDSSKAQEYLALREKYKELEINITLRNVERIELATEALRNDVRLIAGEIEQLTERKGQLGAALSEIREQNDNLEQLGNEAHERLVAKINELNDLANKSELSKERLITIDRDFDRLNSEINALDEKLMRELSNLNGLEENKAVLKRQCDEEELSLRERIDKHGKATADAAELSDKIDAAKEQIIELQSKASSKRSEAGSLESYRISLEKRREQLLADGEAFEQSLAHYESEKRNAEDNRSKAYDRLQQIEKTVADKRSALAGLQDELRALSKEGEDIRIRTGQANSRKKTIEEMENNYEGYNSAVRFVMKSDFRGIRGVASELMRVPSGYEVAVETAMGAAMQNIVCETAKDAKYAITELKKSKAGRLTFLPMESIRGAEISLPASVKQSKGFIGIASELISYASEYTSIFTYLLGRVAVVDNMDTAVSLSKAAGGGLRFVTLDGEIINAAGAITGGRYKNTTANLLARKGEIVKLAAQLDELKESYRKNRTSLSEKTDEAEQLRDEITECEKNQRSLEAEALRADAELRTLQEGYRSVRESEAKKERDLENNKNDFERLLKNKEQLIRDAEEAESRIQQLNAEVTDKLEAFENIRAAVTTVGNEVTEARIAQTKAAEKYAAVCDMINRVLLSKKEIEADVAAKKAETEALQREKSSLMFGNDDAEEAYNSGLQEKEELENYITELSARKSELSEKLGNRTEELTAIGDKLNESQDRKYQLEIKLAKNETQLDTFKEKLWDEFEISYIQAIEFRKENFVLSAAVKESREIKNRIRELGDVNVGAIKEYEQISERYEFLTEQRSDILNAMQELQAIIADMDKTIKLRFNENFNQVVENFEDIFKELFGGGHAELTLEDADNPLESGIEIIAQPPGKKLQNINLMSGGEKTMTAIALMFAVLKTKPTPFCILDEVEAALDDSNIDRFARYLRNFSDIQFAIVTHQKATMEHADVLYGVTMPEQGISKVLSLRLGDDFDI